MCDPILLTERCCSGQGAELEKFLVRSGSALDRLDRSDSQSWKYREQKITVFRRWSSNWQNVATQKLERLGQQNSYDHDTVVKGQKVLESLMVESIDKCRFGGSRVVRRTTTPRPAPITTTTTTAATTSLRTTDSHEALTHPESNDTSEEEEEEGELEEMVVEKKEEEDVVSLSGCFEQASSGPVRVGVSRLNEAGRDFHQRLCDQESSGGGWTVGRSMSSSVVVLTCMSLSLG